MPKRKEVGIAPNDLSNKSASYFLGRMTFWLRSPVPNTLRSTRAYRFPLFFTELAGLFQFRDVRCGKREREFGRSCLGLFSITPFSSLNVHPFRSRMARLPLLSPVFRENSPPPPLPEFCGCQGRYTRWIPVELGCLSVCRNRRALRL